MHEFVKKMYYILNLALQSLQAQRESVKSRRVYAGFVCAKNSQSVFFIVWKILRVFWLESIIGKKVDLPYNQQDIFYYKV